MAADNGLISIHILLDISAAFDTISHTILLIRLSEYWCLTDSTLSSFEWVRSCLLCSGPNKIQTSWLHIGSFAILLENYSFCIHRANEERDHPTSFSAQCKSQHVMACMTWANISHICKVEINVEWHVLNKICCREKCFYLYVCLINEGQLD